MTTINERETEELLTRGIGTFIDPNGEFKKKLLAKARGESKEDLIIKFGVDPTRPDIHLGHAVIFRRLRQFQELGVKVIFLVGDFTAQIGDPTGKSKVRPEVTQVEVEENMKTFLDQVGKILRLDPEVFSWIRNSEWFTNVTDIAVGDKAKIEIDGKKIPSDSFLGKAVVFENSRMQKTHLKKEAIHIFSLGNFLSILKHFTHARIIARDMFQDRLDKHEELYMHEMMYPILQGIDSVAIARIYGSCDLEIGGTDQTFNMIAGRDAMKISGLPEQAVLSMDILPGLDGVEKMSKSLDNYVSITDEATDMFGKIMSISDEAMPSYFALATYTPVSSVEELQLKLAKGTLHPKEMKMRLAREIVTIYHGEKAANEAEADWNNTFSLKGTPKDIKTVEAKKGTKLGDVILEVGLVESKTEWRRLVSEGAVTNVTNGETISSPLVEVEQSLTLKIGKHRFISINVS